MANVSTSTVAYATRQQAGQLVFLASDGTACVLWADGTNQVFSYAASPYSSWTKTTLRTGLNMALGGDFRAGTDNIDTMSGGTSNVRGNYVLLTKSGSTWTVGTSNVATGTTAIGTASIGNVDSYAGQDAQGRHWIVVGGASTYTANVCFYSPANSPTSTGWTASGSVTQTGDVNLPAGDQCGNYLLKIYWNGTALQWHRIDNSVSTLGSWSTAATITNLSGSPNGSSSVTFRGISSTKGVLTYSTGSGVYAQTYSPSGDSWGSATQLSSGANDRHPTIVTDGAGRAWVIWCSYVGSNNYALVYKMYNGTAWDSSPTTIVASGTNIDYPSAGYANNVVGVTYTQGTATPWTVGWVTFNTPVLTKKRAAGRMNMTTYATVYGSTVADGTLTNACDMSFKTGGTESSKNITFPGPDGYAELLSQGGSSATYSSIPTPTGHGWVFSPATTGTFAAGNWSATVALHGNFNGSLSGSITLRFSKYSGGSYSSIGSIALTNPTISSTRAVLSFPATAMPNVSLGSGDLLYVDLWWRDTLGLSGDAVTVYASSSATAGVADDMQVNTTTLTPGVNTATLRGTGRARVAITALKRGAARARLGLRTIGRGMGRARLQGQTFWHGMARARQSIQIRLRSMARMRFGLRTSDRAAGRARLLIRNSMRGIGRARLLIQTRLRATGRARAVIQLQRRVVGRARLSLSMTRRAAARARYSIQVTRRGMARARLRGQALLRGAGRALVSTSTLTATRRAMARLRVMIQTARRGSGRLRFGLLALRRGAARTRLAIQVKRRGIGRARLVIQITRRGIGRARLVIRLARRGTGRLFYGLLVTRRGMGRARLRGQVFSRLVGRVRLSVGTVVVRRLTGRARLVIRVTFRGKGRARLGLFIGRRAGARARLSVRAIARGAGRTLLAIRATRRGMARVRLRALVLRRGVGRVRLMVWGAVSLRLSARAGVAARQKRQASGRVTVHILPVSSVVVVGARGTLVAQGTRGTLVEEGAAGTILVEEMRV